MRIFVLWEDRATGSIRGFGPHTFLLACVASGLTHLDRHGLRGGEVVGGKPCGGNGNVLRELGNKPLWDSVNYVVAVLDTDEMHDRIPGIRSRRQIGDAEYEEWSGSVMHGVRSHAHEVAGDKLEICLLDRNLETLLSLVGRGMPELDSALGKDRMARDKILHRAAADEDLVRKARAEMPSWEYLVTTVIRLMQHNMGLIAAGLT